jgi:hypothetical protein
MDENRLFSTGFDRQPFATFGTTARKNFASFFARHSGTETVGFLASATTRLIGTLHFIRLTSS